MAKTSVVTVYPDSSILEALKAMQTNFVKHIVVTSKKKPVGVVTERDINRFLANDRTSRAIDEIPVNHVMQKNVISVTDDLDDNLEQCANRMETFKIGSVVLVDDEGKLSGIVTRTDIAKAFAVVFGSKYAVKDFMSKKVTTCRKSDSLKFTLNIMNQNEISRVIVTDENGNPLGLITTNTFLTHSDYFTRENTESRDYLLPLEGENMIVDDLISKDLLTINQDDDLSAAASMMIKNNIGGIPVTDSENNLVGIISKTDIVKAFTKVGSHEELKSKYSEL